jgi:hypothetical protein
LAGLAAEGSSSGMTSRWRAAACRVIIGRSPSRRSLSSCLCKRSGGLG